MSDPPPESLLRVERDRLRHQLSEARREIERLQGLLALADAAIQSEYRLRVKAQAEARPVARGPG